MQRLGKPYTLLHAKASNYSLSTSMRMHKTKKLTRIHLRFLALLLFLTLSVYVFGQTDSADKPGKDMTELSVASLEESGINRDSINNLLELISNTPPNDFRGLVVLKDNKIVIEEYFNTFWRISVHDIRSAGKSITAVLLGIAINEGLVQDLEQSVYSFFPKNKYPSINKDYQKIKLKHLLNMSSGLDADTDDTNTPGHAAHWMGSDDWIDYLLSVPLTAKPGEKWVYADIHALLIGAIIEETSNMSLLEFAKEKLFKPLGIEQFYWYTNASNQTGAAGNLYLSTLDFAKIGLLVLNEGKWGSEQVADPDYVNKLLHTTSFDISDNFSLADDYGMMWYKSKRSFGNKTFNYLFASGNGGNHLVIVPEEKMVIALTSSAYGQGYGHRRSFNIMTKVFNALR